ncbi:MAG: aminotransferase class I/II-fold pyridoxal phosphate-dependent enzyme [Myxococcota bacterium]|nr:aminotransferase class I/II-fold pyridoxal phosphate-dependent enzyme [Myxococcota bacterium]
MAAQSLKPALQGMPRSATLAINELSGQLQAEGRNIFRFGLGQSPFPVPDRVVEALREHAGEKDYLAVEGLPALRSAVADFHRLRDGADFDPSGVLVGPGSKELMFLLQLAFDGDLLVPTPCWVSYGPQARMLGHQAVRLPTERRDRWRLRPEQLDAHCKAEGDRPRLLILNYPGNPDGITYSPEELAALAEVARRHGILVLSDEIYGLVHHRGEHVSIAPMYPEGTIVSGGLSKWCGAGGWRLGTFAFPDQLSWLREAMASAASETYTSVCAPVQYAAITAFQGGPDIERYLTDSRRILSALGQHVANRLREAGVQVEAPEGGFYLWLDLQELADPLKARGIADGNTLCEAVLRDVGVAILPGSAFERPEGELTARLAYVDFDGAVLLNELRQGAALDDTLLRSTCPSIFQGVDVLADWIGG